jgi:hypothetical protein
VTRNLILELGVKLAGVDDNPDIDLVLAYLDEVRAGRQSSAQYSWGAGDERNFFRKFIE